MKSNNEFKLNSLILIGKFIPGGLKMGYFMGMDKFNINLDKYKKDIGITMHMHEIIKHIYNKLTIVPAHIMVNQCQKASKEYTHIRYLQ